jgi:hypothetical protein
MLIGTIIGRWSVICGMAAMSVCPSSKYKPSGGKFFEVISVKLRLWEFNDNSSSKGKLFQKSRYPFK